jgi:hypothetical protein
VNWPLDWLGSCRFRISFFIHYNVFVISMRLRRFEGEVVGTVFVYLASFNVCHFYGLIFSCFWKNASKETWWCSQIKKSLCVILLTLYGSPFLAPRMIETYCHNYEYFLDLSLFMQNHPILTVAIHKWHCSTGRGNKIGSKQRHFCPPCGHFRKQTCDVVTLFD